MTAALTQPLLAFDTSTPTARVALLTTAGECLARRQKTAARHSANLLGLVDEVLREAGTDVGELGAIACGSGPGSFTGLRVGLAVAKGLVLPTALPLVLVSSLEALACDLAEVASGAALLLACLDAGKGQVYGRLYEQRGTPLAQGDSDWVLAPGELCSLASEVAAGRALCAGGSGVDRYLDVMRAGLGTGAVRASLDGPSAIAVARLARDRIRRGEHDDIAIAVPRYGRPPDITRPKARQRGT